VVSTRCPVYVLEQASRPIGFYGFQQEGGQTFLHDLFIAPEFVGRGYGRLLWTHLLGTARTAGMDAFLIESDPHAEGFYLRMGARRVGQRVASETGRLLPLLQFEVRAAIRSDGTLICEHTPASPSKC
jgi:GNAT superfamily N-acetyltransferase